MSKSYRLIVFDWEGTLGDTLGQLVHTLRQEANRLQLGEFNEDLARKYLMMGMPFAISQLFPQLTLRQQEELIEAVQYTPSSRSQVYLLPGVNAILNQLAQAGIEMAVASNKSQNSLTRVLQNSGVGAFFNVTRTASQAPAKPCPQMLEEIIDFCGVDRTQTLMVGDSVSDIEMAIRLDVDAVGIDFYYQESQRKALKEAGALQVFTNYQEFANYLKLP
ncbi:hydrolase (haloacid dehalogenase family) (plasmid) [Legionella adelaidensis]|uniref:Hydrolase n=1 Tax=Legionella adelaidensis TaxID=45056 RepID=A0A0W0R320_9GAMM|nr:HAD-IA family hydrolase [Legionella adelaidensis]KTC65458.1 hydrolase [Legionella adelaidensis]VEH84721.1 hydrolase (haloacid dehalogenase family) [Legionella adelaidensis]